MADYMHIAGGLFGHHPVTQDVYNNALNGLKQKLRLLHTALEKRDFLVGNHVTIADVAVVCHASLAMQTVLDPGFRKSIANFDKLFTKVTGLPEFRKRLGNVKACQRAMKPELPKEEKKKEEEDKK